MRTEDSPILSEPNDAPWLMSGDQKRLAVQQMFADVASTYDQVNRIMSFNSDRKWRHKAASYLHLRPGDTVLDLCCGTGDFLPVHRSLIGPSGRLLGLDFCLPMLVRSSGKDSGATLIQADAMSIPVASASVDAVSVGWGIRNVPDIDQVHREIYRVVRSGGRFASVDCAIPQNPFFRAISIWTGKILLPAVGTLFRQRKAYTYLPKSTQKFMSRQELVLSMKSAGFVNVGFQDLFFGNICIHYGEKP